MRKIFILSALAVGLNLSSNAQSIISKVGSAAATSGFDVSSLSSGILGKLTPALNLTPAQQPTVTSMVKDFLVQKATAMAPQKQTQLPQKQKLEN